VARQSRAGAGVVGLLVLFWPELHSTSPLGRRELFFFSWVAGWIIFLGSGIGAVEALAVRHGRVQRYRMAGNGGGRGKLFICARGGRFFPGCVDDARSKRGALSGGVRIVDWIHGLHLAVGTCAHVEGVDVRVCESGGRVFLGWLILHERVDRFIVMGSVIVVLAVNPGYEREGQGEECCGGVAGGGSGG